MSEGTLRGFIKLASILSAQVHFLYKLKSAVVEYHSIRMNDLPLTFQQEFQWQMNCMESDVSAQVSLFIRPVARTGNLFVTFDPRTNT